MTIYAPGEIVLVDFPFVSGGAGVLRPALVILDSGDSDVVLARNTTQQHQSGYDLAIQDWQRAGIRTASFVRLHKLVASNKSCVHRCLGKLQAVDHQRVAAVLQATFTAW